MKTKEEMDELLKNTAVYCKTEEEANQVADLADSLGYTLNTGDRFTDRNLYYFWGDTPCYNIYEGFYGDLDGYIENGYKIISAQEFINLVNNKNKMETGEVQILDVNSFIPEGYEIDKENSTFECIKFKKKAFTYDDVAKELFLNKKAYYWSNGRVDMVDNTRAYGEAGNCTSEKQIMKLAAINKLLNVAKYLNDGWKPNFDDEKEDKWIISIMDGDIDYYITRGNQYPIVYFRTKKLAQQAVEILGEETFQLALSTDY